MTEIVLNNTTNAVFIPTIIAQKAIGRLSSYLSVASNVSKDYDWTTEKMGTTIQVPKRGAVVANDKTAGNVFTKQAPTGTTAPVTLNKHKEVTLTIDDVTKVVENQDTQMGYAEDGAIALAEAVEDTILDLHSSIENTRTWSRATEENIEDSLLAIRNYFSDQKVPLLEQKYFACPTSIYSDLLDTDKYSRYDALGKNTIETGEVLRIYNIEIKENQMVKATGSPVAYHGMAYTRNGICLASRALPQPVGFGGVARVIPAQSIGLTLRTLFWFNADLGAHQLTLEIFYGAGLIDQRRVLEVESF